MLDMFLIYVWHASDGKVFEWFVNQAEQDAKCLVLLDDRRVLCTCVNFTTLCRELNNVKDIYDFNIHPAISLDLSSKWLIFASIFYHWSMQGDGCQISRSGTPRRWFGQLLSLMLPHGPTWGLGGVERLLQSFSQLSYQNNMKCHEHVEFQRWFNFEMV